MVMVAEAEAEAEADLGRGTVEFENLPVGCIAHVVSFTTPKDACRLSLVSSTFRSAAQSDVVWERFLPSDYRTIISQSSPAPSSLSSKKDIYLYLSLNPLLIDDGNKSFVLEKLHGKKCYMLSARNLSIVWGDTRCYWRWISLPEARFSEVAELVAVCWFEIRGVINTGMLSPETLYGAYLVFKPKSDRFYGFEYQPVEVSIGIVGGDTRRRIVYLDALKSLGMTSGVPPVRAGRILNPYCHRVHLHTLEAQEVAAEAEAIDTPKERADGWLEIELGDFFNRGGGGGEDKELEMGVYEVKGGNWKSGLVVQGIDIRPKLIE